MGALAGEPWRGAALVQLDEALGNRHAWAVLHTGVVPGEPNGNQGTWEGNPGDSFTVRVEWTKSGNPVNGIIKSIEVKTFLPGGAQVGATWTVAANNDAGSSERTFHLDDDPLSNAAGTNRTGIVEVYIKVIRDGEVNNYDADSRGVSNGLAGGTTHNWARGYARARGIVSSFSISNVSLGGATPGTFAYPDSTFNRFVLSATPYRSVTVELQHRASAATLRNQVSDSSTATTRDYSWTAASGATAKVLADYPNGAGVDVRAVWQNLSFGGSADKEYAWATSGHAAGWARVDDLNVEDTALFISDPRITIQSLTRTSSLAVVNFGLHAVTGTFRVQNARSENLTSAHGADANMIVKSRDVVGAADEGTISSSLGPDGSGIFSVSFTYSGPTTLPRGTGVNGDTAAHSTSGKAKTIKVTAAGAGSRPSANGSSTFVSLSDLLRLDVHPQSSSTLSKDADLYANPGSGERVNYVISADTLFTFAFVGDVNGVGVSGVDVTLLLFDPSNVQSGSTQVKATQGGGDLGWTTSAASFSVLAPAGAWKARNTVDFTAVGALGNFGDSSVSPFGSLEQTVNFNSAYTADRFAAIHVPDEVAIGVAVTISVEYRSAAGTRLAFDAPPSLRVYKINADGTEANEMALGTMTQYSGQSAYGRSWTPSAEGTYMVEIRATYLGGGVLGTEHVSARPKFDPIALAIDGVLASRM